MFAYSGMRAALRLKGLGTPLLDIVDKEINALAHKPRTYAGWNGTKQAKNRTERDGTGPKRAATGPEWAETGPERDATGASAGSA